MSAQSPSSHEIAVCRGVEAQTNCRFAMPMEPSLVAGIASAVGESGWPDFLRAHVVGPILHHHAFRIAVAACPNGCSRPHVADVGIIRACIPALDPEPCTSCRLCQKTCPDGAIVMDTNGPIFDYSQCMRCGLCVARCPERALDCSQSGFRVVLGGKLGRHPRLATEVVGIHPAECLPAMVAQCLDFYMQQYRKGLRFGTLMEEQGETLIEALENS